MMVYLLARFYTGLVQVATVQQPVLTRGQHFTPPFTSGDVNVMRRKPLTDTISENKCATVFQL